MANSLWTPDGEHPIPSKQSQDLFRRAAAALQAGKRQREEEAEQAPSLGLLKAGRGLSKTADVSSSQISFATGRSHDPMFYWRQSNIPYDYEKAEELIKLRRYAKMIYLTHPVIASCIDVYSHWPLSGMHFECKDEGIVDFYTEAFFEDLNYEDFLPDVAHAYWCMGEALPLGQFNETLGIWEDDELINPDDVNVIRSPFLKEPRFEMRVPEEIRKIVTDRAPEWEYTQLIKAYPELVRFSQTEEFMPVSNILMKQIAFKPDKFYHRGIPIIMRAFRYIYQEEMLNAAVDSIASRLYTPLILVRLGASASDMGTDVAWVPTAADLDQFQMALDSALAADFRVLTSHFATEVDQVFGRENMPDFTSDYDRLMDRQLMAFGLSRTILMGADSGETYAADALNRDLVTMMLARLRRYMTKFYKERAMVVAEAQGHYDYEMRGGKPYPIMEEKLIIDKDGNRKIVEQPKLLIPDLVFDTMNLQDEETRRQFVEMLADKGVPISWRTRVQNLDIDFEEEYEVLQQEQVDMAVKTQETRKEAYLALRNAGLPIPQDLEDDFGPKVINAEEVEEAQEAQEEQQQMAELLENLPLPNEMMDQASPSEALMPTEEGYMNADEVDEGNAEPEAPPQADMMSQLMEMLMPSSRPPESDEMRASMPKPASLDIPGIGVVEEGPHRLLSGPSHIGRWRPGSILRDAEGANNNEIEDKGD